MTHYIGIDIGGTKIAAGLVDATGNVGSALACATPRTGGHDILLAATSLARQIVDAGGKDILAVGVGSGGQIDPVRGTVVSATDVLPGWAGTHVASSLADLLNLRVAVDNDVNALAIGEQRFGSAAGRKVVVFLALGTGVGGALLVNGRLHYGANWSGAEFGHILIDTRPDARRDLGGAMGTLEAYASGPGLLSTWQEIIGEQDLDMTAHDVVRDAENDPGGAGALAVRKTGEYLGYGLVTLANALDPDMIVIGGGLSSLGDALLAPACAILRERGLPGAARCPVVAASLGEHASVIGAACIAMS